MTWGWIIAGGVVAVLLLVMLLALGLRASRRLIVTYLIGFKYSLLWLADLLGLRWLAARLRGRPYRRLLRPRILRLAFEDLGPSYIKLGQIIASSPGLFTERYVEEFRYCLDRVRPFPFDELQQIVHEDLQGKADELTIEATPLASASIAQVHVARTASGREIVVKVQRPNIQRRVDADVRIMLFWARLAQTMLPRVRLANPVGIVEDFGETIREELDFTQEARNIDEFNRIMRELGNDRVTAPTVLWEYTTRRVLTMDRLFGHNVDDVEAVKASGLEAEEMLLLGMRAWFQSVMLYGLFHGDVHAGNLMWLDDGRVGFLDFGIVGRFDDRQRRLVTRYIVAMAMGHYEELAKVVMEMGSVPAGVDVDALAKDMEKAYGPLRGLSMGQLKYGDILPNILAMARKHRVTMPKEFILIVKQVLYFDRYAKLLAPNLNLFTDPRMVTLLAGDVQKALALTNAMPSTREGNRGNQPVA